MKILLVDDQPEICSALKDYLTLAGNHDVYIITDSLMVISFLEKTKIDLVISDVRMPGLTGIQLARRIEKLDLPLEIVLISGEDDIIRSIDALNLGVCDFLTKPVDLNKLSAIINEIGKSKDFPETDFDSYTRKDKINIADIKLPDGIFYELNDGEKFILYSEKMRNIQKQVNKLSNFSELPVMIVGKTGSGKELIAKMIHKQTTGGDAPFIALNCAAIEENLFESELFGYEKGSFTGADRNGKSGKFELAEGGTLFLDEITEISLSLQTKLLRVLQEREYYRVGGDSLKTVNARIICATNRDMAEIVGEGRFREDLYYRLDICKLVVPELNARREAIAPLALHLIKEISQKYKLPIKAVSGKVLQVLKRQDWPGNVRQLKNYIMRAMLFCDGDTLNEQDLEIFNKPEKHKTARLSVQNMDLPNGPFSLNGLVEGLILKSLKKFEGNKAKASRFLGLDRYQFYRRYKNVVDKYEESPRNSRPGTSYYTFH